MCVLHGCIFIMHIFSLKGSGESHDSGDEHKKRDEEKGTKILPRKDVSLL